MPDLDEADAAAVGGLVVGFISGVVVVVLTEVVVGLAGLLIWSLVK